MTFTEQYKRERLLSLKERAELPVPTAKHRIMIAAEKQLGMRIDCSTGVTRYRDSSGGIVSIEGEQFRLTVIKRRRQPEFLQVDDHLIIEPVAAG